VVTDGPGRDKEPLGDLGVGVTAADQAENLTLTLGQPGGVAAGGAPGPTGMDRMPAAAGEPGWLGRRTDCDRRCTGGPVGQARDVARGRGDLRPCWFVR